MQIHRRWPIDWARPPSPAGQLATALLVPDFPVPRGMPAEAAALLPNSRYNQNLLDSLALRSPQSVSSEVATVFAADPFLNVALHGRALQRRGITRLANLPTMAQLGSAFLAMSEEVDMGVATEFSRLRQFAEQGFELFVAVTSVEHVSAALEIGAVALIVMLEADGSLEPDRLPEYLTHSCHQVLEEVKGSCPVLALTGERLSGFKAPVAGTIRTAA